MKKLGKLILWLIGLFLMFEIVSITILFLSRRIRPNTFLTARIEGDIAEQATRNPLAELLAGPPMTFTQIAEALDRAKAHPRYNGITLPAGESTLQMSKLQEV